MVYLYLQGTIFCMKELTLIYDTDGVCVPHCGEPVRDDYCRSVLGCGLQGSLYHLDYKRNVTGYLH